ncbi:MAG: carboxypeptidase regulatory-like domain-containing protein [Gemmatimonadota bacterium]|nr:carboxypeptidase regulatory-like domain-containing protein [Gemmatimonadota bacterium]
MIALFGLIAALAAASSLPATELASSHQQLAVATGRIEGEVTISTTLSARRPRFRIYADPGPGSRPPAPAPEAAEIRNVVLYLEPAPALEAGAATHATMRQEDERFAPHVLPVLAGTTVDFPNGDDVFHNVFSLSSAKTFDLGRFPKGSAKSVQFDRSGVVQVFCHIHSDMSAVVLVLDNAFHTVPAADGRYTLEGVPPGEYTVVGWHERIKPISRTIRVRAGETARQDFNIPLPRGGETVP